VIIILSFVFSGLGLILFMWLQANANQISNEVIEFDNFPESFSRLKLFFISDIHRRSISRKLIDKVKKEQIDFVIIGGDLIEKGVPMSRTAQNLELLKEIGPVYFVWGNNDYEVDFHKLDALLLDHRVYILDNTAAKFESEDGEFFSLLGVDSVTNNRDRLDLALLDSSDSDFRILVSHDPAIVKKIKKEDQIDLVLCGHTHGGQIRLGKLGFYEKGGVKKGELSTVFVSNGYGTSLLPLRFGAPALTHIITIKGK
jgi:predicted MPP superfamily phosphohydrolase